jgi:tetratricopeptide (TPR) repeat protein
MKDDKQSGGVNAQTDGNMSVGENVVGRDNIKSTTNVTHIENTRTATYAIAGIVVVAVIAIVAIALTRPPDAQTPAEAATANSAPLAQTPSAASVQIVPASTPSAKKHYDQGNAHYKNQEFDLAIVEFTEAVNLGYTPLADAYDYRGWAYYKGGRSENNQGQIDAAKFDKAKQDFTQALILTAGDPTGVISTTGNSSSYQGLGWIYYREGQQEEDRSRYEIALRYFLAALNRGSGHSNADILLGVGWSSYRLGQYENAIVYFQQLLAIDPGYADAFAGIGWSYYRQQRYTDAIDNFQKALEIDKDLADARDGLERAQKESGQRSPNN